jgi:spore germination cell wall hydrolase CwlJ-like protein
MAAVLLAGWAARCGAAPTPPTYGQQVVAAVLMAEAWGEGEAAMTAVAEVIRLRADDAGRSPLWVVQQPLQFSCLNGVEPRNLIRKFRRHRDFELALRIARRIYNRPEELTGIARGATHFERAGTRAYWTSGHRPVARYGRLDFYRLPRGRSDN